MVENPYVNMHIRKDIKDKLVVLSENIDVSLSESVGLLLDISKKSVLLNLELIKEKNKSVG